MSLGIRNTSFNKRTLVKNNHTKPTVNIKYAKSSIVVHLNKNIAGIEDYVCGKFKEVVTFVQTQHDAISTKFCRSAKSSSITNYPFHQYGLPVLVYKTKTDSNKQMFMLGCTTNNTIDCQKFICTNFKSQHLFNQVRLFKTDTPNDFKKKIQSSKFLQFLGIKEKPINFKIRDDLENFQTNLAKENINAELKQKAILSFAEGYIQAMENIVARKSWMSILNRMVIIGLSCAIGFAIGSMGQISIELTSAKEVNVEESQSNVKFSDVKGAEEAKEELQNIVEFLKNPDKYSALGGKLPKGVLLVGPPGTGKTLLAKAVAGEAGVPFFSTSGPEFEEVFVGMGARRIRELFKLAKESIPCVIFIDEIDSIGKERTSSSVHPYANDTINQLLSEMDGFRNTKGIIVLGATNRKKDLDKALLRPGRFDVEVNVQVPDYRGRKELLEFYLKNVRHQDVDVIRLARGTTNFTGADIENLVNQDPAAHLAGPPGTPVRKPCSKVYK